MGPIHPLKRPGLIGNYCPLLWPPKLGDKIVCHGRCRFHHLACCHDSRGHFWDFYKDFYRDFYNTYVLGDFRQNWLNIGPNRSGMPPDHSWTLLGHFWKKIVGRQKHPKS